MTLLERIGGQTVKATVKLAMNRLFTNRAMSFMNMDGRSLGKEAFRAHPLCKTVVGAILWFSIFVTLFYNFVLWSWVEVPLKLIVAIWNWWIRKLETTVPDIAIWPSVYNWAKVGTVYSKMGGRGEPRNSKNLPQWDAEFGIRHHGIWQNLPRKTVSPINNYHTSFYAWQYALEVCTGQSQAQFFMGQASLKLGLT